MQQTIRCRSCGSPNSPGQKFCGVCGIQLGSACPNCGAGLDPNDRFCGNCGAQMPASAAQQRGYQQSRPPQNPYGQQPAGSPQQWGGAQPGGWGSPPPPPQQGAWGAPQGAMGYQGTWQQSAPRKSSAMPLVVLLLVLIIALGGFAYWAFLGSPPWAGQSSSSSTITTGPFISAAAGTAAGTRDITITWETGSNTVGKIDYGSDTTYGSSSQWEASYAKSHSVKLSGLTADTRYHYRVTNKDQSGNETNSIDYTFSSGTTPESSGTTTE